MSSAVPKAAFVVAALVAAALYEYALRVLGEASEIKAFSAAQIAVALAYGCVLVRRDGSNAPSTDSRRRHCALYYTHLGR